MLHLEKWCVNLPIYDDGRATDAVARAAAAIAGARSRGDSVIHVKVAFRRGGGDISARNPLYSRLSPTLGFYEDDPGTEFHDAVQPQAGDVVVVNLRVSAFAGSDLQLVLRSLNVTHLVVCGVGTGGAVLSTVREAADLDYELAIFSDACADSDDEIHNFLLEKILPKQGLVKTVDEWIVDPAYSHDRVQRKKGV